MKYFVASGEDRRLDATSRRALRGSFAELSDGSTHYELMGPDRGTVVILVGGLTTPLFYWDAMARALHARGLQTLAFSGYGRGYSERVRGTYDEELFVRQLDELAHQLGLPRPLHLAATSMGALTAMAFAARHPPSIASMTLVAPAGLGRQPLLHRALSSDRAATVIAKRFGSRILQGHLDKEVLDPRHATELAAMVADAFRCEGSVYAVFDTLQHFPLFGRADRFMTTGELGVPMCLIWGKDDRVTPIIGLEQARALLRPRQTHVIASCGHMPPFERPRDVADLIAAFTTAHQPRS